MAQKAAAIEREVLDASKATNEVLHRTTSAQSALERIETLSQPIAEMSHVSMRSLASMASQLSRTSSRLKTAWEDNSDGAESLDLSTIVMSSWETSLLVEWTGTRDRINRWILHTMGADADQAKARQRILADEMQCVSDGDRSPHGRAWSRLVLKY